MYNLFTTAYQNYKGKLEFPQFENNLAPRYVADLEKVVNYYRLGSFAAKNTHILVRLLMTMDVPMQYDPDQFYQTASNRSLQVATALGMTTAINPGRFHSGNFYHGCPELVIAYNGTDKGSELVKNWKDLQPVRVLEHPVSNMKFMLPNGVNHNTERGLSVIAVDIPMLMIQLREFTLGQVQRLEDGVGSFLGTTHFVYKYVFPNMLKSQTDLAIFNRLYNLYLGRPHGDSIRRHPFYLGNYDQSLDNVLEKVLDRLTSISLPYPDVLEQLPRLFSDRFLAMPDIAETRQVWWALWLTRQKAMRFLYDVPGEKTRRTNGTFINRLRIDSRELLREHVMEARVHPSLLEETFENLKLWSQWPNFRATSVSETTT